MDSKEKKYVSVKVDKELYDVIKIYAKKNGKKYSYCTDKALRNFIKSYIEK